MTTYSSYAGFSSPNFSQSAAAHLSDVTMINSGSSSTAFDSPSQPRNSFSGASGSYFDTPSLAMKPMQVLRRDLQGTGMKGGFFTSPIAKGSLSTAEALALSFTFSPTQIDRTKSFSASMSNKSQEAWAESCTKFREDNTTYSQEDSGSATLSFGELLDCVPLPSSKVISAHYVEPASVSSCVKYETGQDKQNAVTRTIKIKGEKKPNRLQGSKKRPPPLKFSASLEPPSVHVDYAPDWSQFREGQQSPAFSAGGDLISPSYSTFSTSPITPNGTPSNLYPIGNADRSSTPDMGPFASLSLQTNIAECVSLSTNQFLNPYQSSCSVSVGQMPPMLRSHSTPIPLTYNQDNVFSDESTSPTSNQSVSSVKGYYDWNQHAITSFYAAPVNMSNICDTPLMNCLNDPSSASRSYAQPNKRRRASLDEPNNFRLTDLDYDDDCASQMTSNSHAEGSELYSKYWEVFKTNQDQSSITLSGGKSSNHQSKQYRCLIDDCGKCFVRRSGMQTHVQMHLEDKPFACAVPGCHAAFVRSHDLRRHDRIHSGSKTFQCPCGKWFGRGDALAIHRKRGICSGSLVPLKPLKGSRPKRKGKDEAEE